MSCALGTASAVTTVQAAKAILPGRGEPAHRLEPSPAPHIVRASPSTAITATTNSAAHSSLPISRERRLKPAMRISIL